MKNTIKFILGNWFWSIPILISIAALILSFVSWGINKNNFLSTNRPYVLAENFAIKNKENFFISTPETVLILVMNVPAKIITENINYYIEDKDGNKKEIYSEIKNNFVRYPSDKIQSTHTSKEVWELLNKNNQKIILYRFIKIDYGWLSHSKEKYYFEGKWKYNSEKNNWDIEYIKAN